MSTNQRFTGPFSTAVFVSNGLTHDAQQPYGSAEGNALRWIEIRKNIDAIKTLYNASDATFDETRTKAFKRLLRSTMASAGFYLDAIDYANTPEQLEGVYQQVLDEATARVAQYWKPGMPGYGIESLPTSFKW